MREHKPTQDHVRTQIVSQLSRSFNVMATSKVLGAIGLAAAFLATSAVSKGALAEAVQSTQPSESTAREQDAPREARDGDRREGETPDAPRRDRASRGGRSGGALPPDWPRAGGFGGRDRPFLDGLVADEFLSDLARRELTDEELARAIRICLLYTSPSPRDS